MAISDDDNVFIEHSEQVKAAMKNDPKLAEHMRDFQAILRQAMAGVQSGQYGSFEDAMFVLTGQRPERIENNDD